MPDISGGEIKELRLNFQQLSTFVTVLSEGSMTAAAEKLYLTQPAVSQQIRNLEDDLGVELLVRGVRQVKPTLQGQLLYEYARKIMHLTRQAEVAIQSMSSDVKGHLRVGTLNSIGMFMISPVVGMFLKNNADLSVKLNYGSGNEILTGMSRGELDVVILPETEKEYGRKFTEYEERFLMKDEMWLVGAGRDTSLPRKISLQEYTSQSIVNLLDNYPGFARQLSLQLDKASVAVKPVFETTNVGTLKRVIESGLGWGFLPSHAIRKQVRTRRMTLIEVDEIKYGMNLMYYTKHNIDAEPAADVLYRALSQTSKK